MFDSNQIYMATCKANDTAIIIQTRSGLGITIIDHLFPPHILSLEIDNDILGKVIFQALSNSRTFIYGSKEEEDFFDLNKGQQRYDIWVKNLCEQLQYKNKRTLFKNMKDCSIRLSHEKIKISPSKHVKLEAWEGIDEKYDVYLTLDNSPEEIGAGLRLALSRCL